MSIKGANKSLGTRVDELSTNIVGVEDRLNERLAASDRQRTYSLQVVIQSLNHLTATIQRLQARDVAPRWSFSPQRCHDHDNDDVGDFFRTPMLVEAYLTDHGMRSGLTAMLVGGVTMVAMVPRRMMDWVESR
ncbi:hypothetical protein D1007_12427 [Hordeum vulgare]|nr:hypothetical protein D1007_12427 [Hordeum vulgare]